MRLSLARCDHMRAQIVSKKISVKFFEDAANDDLKRKFYRLMIQLARHDNSYLDICKHNRALLDTVSVQGKG